MSDFDISSVYEQQVSESLVKEATAFKTIRAGAYNGLLAKVDGKVGDQEKSPWPGRKMAHMQFTLSDKDGAKKGSIFVDASWEEYRVDPETKRSVPVTDDNREDVKGWALDKQSKLWGQLQKAVGLDNGSIGEVLNKAKETYIVVFVTETFKGMDDNGRTTYKNYKTESERDQLVSEGLEPANYVQSFSKVKA